MMAAPHLITKEYLEKGIDQGMTIEQMAVELGVHTSSIKRAKLRYGLSTPQLDHKWAIPWVLDPEHMQSTEAQYLRVLSTAAQSPDYRSDKLRKAGQWADKLIQEGKDLTYNHGWVIVDADENNWHLMMVIQACIDGEIPNP